MTKPDPFADAPADEPQGDPWGPPPEEAPKKAPAKKATVKSPKVASDSEGKVVVTLKGGSGFDAPWIVIHAADLADAEDQFTGENAVVLASLMERAQLAAKKFTALAPEKAHAAAPRAAAPAEAQGPPAGAPPAPGPDWTFKSGVSKATGKPWKGWMPPRGSDERPVFF